MRPPRRKSAQDEPNHGLLGTWSRACVLQDGRGIDMEYRLPTPVDRRHEWASSLVKLFWENGYHLEFFSFPERIDAHYYELIALPISRDATSPEAMDGLMREQFQEHLSSKPVEASVSIRAYGGGDGRKLAIRFVRLPMGGSDGSKSG